jgi:hypothetical protein
MRPVPRGGETPTVSDSASGRRGWIVAVLALAVVVLFLLETGLQASQSALSVAQSGSTPATAAPPYRSGGAVADPYVAPAFNIIPPVIENCYFYVVTHVLHISGPGCSIIGNNETESVDEATVAAAAESLMIGLFDFLNITNAEVANLNATFQELLSYFEVRAEAIIPGVLNQTWSTNLSDQIAIDSGLVPSLIGVEQAFAYQEFQDWNATATGWNQAFGSIGAYSGVTRCLDYEYATNAYSALVCNGQNLNVTQPYEVWQPNATIAPNGTYFDMSPGGTIVAANIEDYTSSVPRANLTVYDLTTGSHFYVPDVTFSNWVNGSYPIESTVHSIGQFDLLKVVCNANCTSHSLDGSAYETTASYALENQSTGLFASTTTPELEILYPGFNYAGRGGGIVPRAKQPLCISASGTAGPCLTTQVLPGGNSTEASTSPTAAVGGPRTLSEFSITAQHLVNNTMAMAYVYYQVLRAVTDNGTYAIPSSCAIPEPSDAFPSATDFQNYNLSIRDVEAVYLSYLNAVARGYGEVFTNQVGFCDDPNLGFSFNWTGSWTLTLNVTASVYLGSAAGALDLNGSPNSSVTYAHPATWPVYDVVPTLLYPYEYDMSVPVGVIYPVPINNPLIGVLVDFPSNLYYGSSAFSPKWGIPTYVSLTGEGNYTNTSGVLSSVTSGEPVADGDAIEISSCLLNGVPQNPCIISATYFSAFTIGHVHAIIVPPVTPPSGGGSSGLNGGFCSSLFSWIPYIGGDLTTLCNLILGFLEIVVIIVALVVIVWALSKVASARGGRGSGSGATVNVYTSAPRRRS